MPYNMSPNLVRRMRDLGTKDIQTLIAIRGLVLRVSEIIPEMALAVFKCSTCEDIQTAELVNAKIIEPKYCDKCRRAGTMELIHNMSKFIDKQYVKLQENPEEIPEGETAQNIIVQAMLENVDQVRPGDRVELIGI